jgi:hypothetical protein
VCCWTEENEHRKNEGLRAEAQRKGRGIYREAVVGTGARRGRAGRDDEAHVDGWAGGYERRRGHAGASPSAESKKWDALEDKL